ncbi:glycoside hydrolase, family 16 [Poronia punctata]|nr:glycoside hydrolase, family 16 [Poronia punctata]
MTLTWIFGVLLVLFDTAIGDCECGYSMTVNSDGTRHVFTDLLETDFVHADVTGDGRGGARHGWAPQGYNITREAARGAFGESFMIKNVMSDTIKDGSKSEGTGPAGPDAGLHLVVREAKADDRVPVAEISTTGLDYLYGTFRAGIRITDVAGTCSAFFWYQNDTQEIDIEFLSAEFDRANDIFPVNLVLQTRDAAAAGYDASNTTGLHRVNLPFDPSAAFHEYRFDFLKDRVLFYADANLLSEMTGDGVPTSPGHILLSHWSNGNPGWSRGPPASDAVTTVSYVKAYFNSSLEQRQQDFMTRCKDPAAKGAVCAIPDRNPTFFFSNGDNMTPNQTTYTDPDDGGEDENAVLGKFDCLTAMVRNCAFWATLSLLYISF